MRAIPNNNNNEKLKDNKTNPHKVPSKNSKSINIPRKENPIVGDSILKHVEGSRLSKRMKSTIPIRFITGASTKWHSKPCRRIPRGYITRRCSFTSWDKLSEEWYTSEKNATDKKNLKSEKTYSFQDWLSSNVNEVIRAVCFFFTKRFHTH